MTVTSTTLIRGAAAAAVAAGAVFVGVQVGHPPLDVTTIGTTEVVVRNTAKLVMAVLALAGITGLYLSQVRRNGWLGLAGWLVLALGYVLILATTAATAYVLPEVASSDPAYVADVISAAKGDTPAGDIGALGVVLQLQGIAYLGGGLLLGIALLRAGVLARWACALLAVGGVVTAALAVMPDAFYRLLALPNGIAMIGLGISLWRSVRTQQAVEDAAPVASSAGVR
jgi:hypothetical protein